MHRVALAVAEQLNFDMARVRQVFLDIDIVIAEGGARFGASERVHFYFSDFASVATFMPLPPPPAGALINIG